MRRDFTGPAKAVALALLPLLAIVLAPTPPSPASGKAFLNRPATNSLIQVEVAEEKESPQGVGSGIPTVQGRASIGFQVRAGVRSGAP